MAKASRARVRLNIVPPNESAPLVADLCSLIGRAEGLGVREKRAARWRYQVRSGAISPETLLRCERRLRLWIQAHVKYPHPS
jgi:hypothetical protein